MRVEFKGGEIGMSITKLFCSIVGVLLSVCGTIAHELGARAAMLEIGRLPGGAMVVQYPLATLALGMTIFTIGNLFAGDRIANRY